jgi:hypothetical protein
VPHNMHKSTLGKTNNANHPTCFPIATHNNTANVDVQQPQPPYIPLTLYIYSYFAALISRLGTPSVIQIPFNLAAYTPSTTNGVFSEDIG